MRVCTIVSTYTEIYFMNSTWRAQDESRVLSEKGQRNVNVLQPDIQDGLT